jgi:hypothetical protein
VGLGAFISRLDRWAGRFNRWFGSTALAAGAEGPGAAGGPPTVDPASVVAALGEMEQKPDGEKQTEPRG